MLVAILVAVIAALAIENLLLFAISTVIISIFYGAYKTSEFAQRYGIDEARMNTDEGCNKAISACFINSAILCLAATFVFGILARLLFD